MSKNKKVFGTLGDVAAAKIRWFWKPFIPYGMMTILEGDPGIGKSYLTMHLAASVTVGGTLATGEKIRKGRVLLMSAEDDPAYTIRPRIEAMGGDPERVRYMAEYSAFDDEGLKTLRSEVLEFGPSLIIIDPLYAFVPSASDMYKPNEIRALLAQLSMVAAENDAAMVVIRHLRKSKSDKAIYQGVGSIDVIGAARSAVLVALHPDDPDVKVIAHLKHNLAPRGESWMYQLIAKSEDDVPRLDWLGRCALTVDDLGGAPIGVSAIEEAMAFLRDELKGGPRPAAEISTVAASKGISSRTIDRAKQKIGRKARKQKDQWLWSLPE
ncbi:MAG: AAA family ATPase [Rhodoblastus sp.]